DRGPEPPRSALVADRTGALDGKDVPDAVGVTGNEVGGLRLERDQTRIALVVRNHRVRRGTIWKLPPGRGRDRRARDQLRVLEPSAVCARADCGRRLRAGRSRDGDQDGQKGAGGDWAQGSRFGQEGSQVEIG